MDKIVMIVIQDNHHHQHQRGVKGNMAQSELAQCLWWLLWSGTLLTLVLLARDTFAVSVEITDDDDAAVNDDDVSDGDDDDDDDDVADGYGDGDGNGGGDGDDDDDDDGDDDDDRMLIYYPKGGKQLPIHSLK